MKSFTFTFWDVVQCCIACMQQCLAHVSEVVPGASVWSQKNTRFLTGCSHCMHAAQSHQLNNHVAI